jgi:hypothetical protein
MILAVIVTGGLVGGFLGRWWSMTAAVILVPPLAYLGIGLGVWGNGFGENWQYAIPFTFMIVVIAIAIGFAAKRLMETHRQKSIAVRPKSKG